jgi:hypothetical protein
MSNPSLAPLRPIISLSKDDIEKHTSNEVPTDEDNFGPAPDGGTQAWLTALGGFSIFFGCLGFTSCFGVLQEYYSTHQLKDRSPSEIAWIGSVSSFIQFSGGAVGGPMFDRFGIKVRYNNPYRRKKTNAHIDPPASYNPLCLRPDDGQSMHLLLPIHARTGPPNGLGRRLPTIPRLCRRSAIL